MKFINLVLNYFLRLILIKDSPLEKPFPFVVNNDHIGKQILIDGFYERFFLENIINYLDNSVFSNTMVDVGANIGNHSVFFSKYFNQIFSFEPQKRTFQILEMNCSNISNIKEPIISQLNRLGYRDFFVFKKELIKNPFLKLFIRRLSKLKKIDLSLQNNFSMVVTYRRDSNFLLKNIF